MLSKAGLMLSLRQSSQARPQARRHQRESATPNPADQGALKVRRPSWTKQNVTTSGHEVAAALGTGAIGATVSVSGLVKRFGGVLAVRKGDLDVYPGEVHVLLGENGAGKSTMVNMLAGVIQPDAGVIRIDGRPVVIANPNVARALGIHVVHQHPVLFPDLSVAENIMFTGSRPPTRGGLLDWKAIRKDAKRALERLGSGLDPNRLVGTLSSADQQLLEIVKALSGETKVLILDEPTAALSKREVGGLMAIIARLKAQGVAIVFVGHRLDEVFALADRVTVARDGGVVASGPVSEFTPATVVSHMVGRTIESLFPKMEVPIGAISLEVRNLTRAGAYANVNFSVRSGEILGLAGLVGAGRTEIAQGLFGLEAADSGEIQINGSRVSIKSPNDAMRFGIAYVPEDRPSQGVILEQSIQFNSSLAVIDRLSAMGFIKPKRDADLAQSSISRLSIRTSGADQAVGALSGGNQQKVVLGKWLASNPSILILDDPTKGVDVGAKSELYKIAAKMVQDGLAIILISNELEELLAVSDRVITFYRGVQGQEFTHRPFDQEKVLASITRQVEHVEV